MLFEINKDKGIPLLGSLCFGVIDRGTNLLQIRPNCGCNLSCTFCSVDAGPNTKTRITKYLVEKEYLVETVERISEFKGNGIECHIDSPGEPMLYPYIYELISDLKKIPQVEVVSMQSNGTLFDFNSLKKLEDAGLDRINLSIHSMDSELSKKIVGAEWYDIEKIKKFAKVISESRISLLIAPVYLPRINDKEISKIIEFAKEIDAGGKWPGLGIQKYERYRLGRKPRGVKKQSWWKFFNKSIKKWEKEFDLRLKLKPEDFGIEKRRIIPIVFEKGEKVNARIAGPGWIRGEKIGIARNRTVSILNCPKKEGSVKVKILSNKHGIYVAKLA